MISSQILKVIKQINKEAKFYTTSIGILGAPFSKGQGKNGVDKAPEELRNFGLIKELQEIGLDVKDYGDIKFEEDLDSPTSTKLRFPLTVGSACHKVSEAVKQVLKDNRKCLTLGGDHSLGMGTVHGHSQVHDNICVLWIDAHADINTISSSPSGNFHGMPCSFLIKELQKYKTECPGFGWLKPCVKKNNFAYIGLREIDPFEKMILTKEEILHFSMRDIDRLGIFEVTNRAIESINPNGKLSMHISFDIDSIDKLIIPSTGTPVLGGLTVREALCLAEEISKLDSVSAIDVVEVNPVLGNKDQIENTLKIAILIIKAFLGYSRSGSIPLSVNKMATYIVGLD